MDLQYFLEMVDVKHRHGSNLRAYHTVWKNSPSSENFFYWLDHGEGKRVDLPQRPRERLEKEQVRYLSPEERFNYLVKVDEAGLFRWTKNNELVDTDDKRFKDSVHGVVHAGDDAPRFKGYSEEGTIVPELQSTSARSLPSQQVVADEDDEESELSMTEEYDLQEAPEKPARITPAAMYDRSAANVSFKKGTWLFVGIQISY